VRRELDFTTEASMIERFRANHAEIDTVFVPSVYPEACTEHVLTMDFVDGVRIDDLGAYAERNCDPERVAATALDVLCKQIFEFNLFHADPHPGNIKLMRDDTIAFIDYGMMGHLERSDVESMAELLSGIVGQNTDRTVRALMAFTPVDDIDPPDPLVNDIADFVAFEAPLLVQGGEFSAAVRFVTETLRQNQLQIKPRFSLLLKALATIEVTAHRIDPDLELIPVLQPYIEAIAVDRFSPPNLFEGAQYDLPALARMARHAPGDAFALLRKLRRGRFHLTVTAEGLQHLSNALDRASNRVAFAVIMGGLIIGSSILMSTQFAPRGIGPVGFSIAGVLGLGLAISILRSRNY
jgi:ubiquinone biosynthesis protein